MWFLLILVVVFAWAAYTARWLIVGIAIILLIGMYSEQQRPAHQDNAAAYREAQEAVARATGHPCDYACKVMIADQARRKDL